MLFKNLFIENATEAVDIRVTDGKFEKIAANLTALPGEEVVDCGGKLALPPVIESHVHLDTCLTAGRPRWNMSGTLFEGIQCWEEYKPFLTKQEVKDRVNKAIRMQASNGIQHVRTHVDINDPKLTAMEALLELRDEVKDFMDIQIVAFPQYGILSYPKGKELLEDALKMGADAVLSLTSSSPVSTLLSPSTFASIWLRSTISSSMFTAMRSTMRLPVVWRLLPPVPTRPECAIWSPLPTPLPCTATITLMLFV